MRILLAEDEGKVAEHVRQGMQAEGYAVDLAHDGSEALWLAEIHPYDALILDVMLPGADGFTVVRNLRHNDGARTSFILDASGKVRFIHSGFHGQKTRDEYAREIESLLSATGAK